MECHSSASVDWSETRWTISVRHTFLDVTCEQPQLNRSRSSGDLNTTKSPVESSELGYYFPSLSSLSRKSSHWSSSNITNESVSTASSMASPSTSDDSDLETDSKTAESCRSDSSGDTRTPSQSSGVSERAYCVTSPLSRASRRRERRRRLMRTSAAEDAPHNIGTTVDEPPKKLEGLGAIVAVPVGETELEKASSINEILEVVVKLGEHIKFPQLLMAVHNIAKFVDKLPVQGQGFLSNDARLRFLVSRMAREIDNGLHAPRLVARMIWSLGKVGFSDLLVTDLLKRASRLAAGWLSRFTTQELSNTLWGLARIGCGSHEVVLTSANDFAGIILSESSERIPLLTAQCLANSLWSLAKLNPQPAGGASTKFVSDCLTEMCRNNGAKLADFTEQGLANTLWATARLRTPDAQAATFCSAFLSEAGKRELSSFGPQELSMILWALAKIAGRPNCRPSNQQREQHGKLVASTNTSLHTRIEHFALLATTAAHKRLDMFGAQGLSNIAWALATLELGKNRCVRQYLIEAASRGSRDLQTFPPQAIANFCWALGRLRTDHPAFKEFFVKVAKDATRRMAAFEWQDLAAIAMALTRFPGLGRYEGVATFCRELALRTGGSEKIGTQALLNIAVACKRLGLPLRDIFPLIRTVTAQDRVRTLNEIDHRQWQEVANHYRL